ncbi:hypothetical protein DSO57_1004241 [Entomophthora muscae]|uniref:Uncharacterized protein n=1 Tax=Entomophthora muscae TaxID=34485 RepID=A0ACC2SAD5_9FUNG|nr:hypothetical protein DSO57_1004241 [Entomophthora muscae]
MQAIQQTMATRHAKDRARVEALTNKSKTGDHNNPSTPATVHIDVEPTAEERTIHPDLEDWKKANNKAPKTEKKQKTQQPKPTQEPPNQTQPKPSFTINDPAPKDRPCKGNPIPIPGEDHMMQTDFGASQFPSYKKYNPPKQDAPISKHASGTHKKNQHQQ